MTISQDDSLSSVGVPALTTQKQPHSNSLPGDREIAAKIAALLLHYPIGNISDAARAQMANDWVEDLREFGPYLVGEGCKLWRQKPGGKRPTPGDVRALCIEAQTRHRNLSNQVKNDEQAGGTWPDWLFELWGPESTGRPARDAAIARQEAKWHKFSPEELQRQGRATLNQYARDRGYADWDAGEAAGLTYTQVVKSFPGFSRMPGSRPRGE